MTTTDLDVIDDHSELQILPPSRPINAAAIATLREHADAMDVAYGLAVNMCKTELVPLRYRHKPEDATAAILFGAELGLNPIQSLQNIFAVHGSPGMYARTMKALLRRQGYKFRTVEKTAEVCEMHGWEPGHNPNVDDPDEWSRWTIEDARRAEYAPMVDEKTGTWKTYKKKGSGETAVLGNMKYVTDPKAMLIAKVTAEVCRNLAPDVLLGIPYSVEELESERALQVRSERVQPTRGGRGVASLRERASAEAPAYDWEAQAEKQTQELIEAVDRERAEQPPEPKPEPRPRPAGGDMSDATRRKWLNRMFALLTAADCPDRDDQFAVQESITGRTGLEHRDELSDDELRQVVNQLNAWDKASELGQQVTDILNSAALAAEGIENTNQEGNTP